MKRVFTVVIVAAFAVALFRLPNLANAKGFMMQTPSPDIPAGTIVAYGGKVTGKQRDRLWRAGWLPCDGTVLQESQGLAVFQVIERYWGGNKERREYKLPDLRGRFVRGVLGTGPQKREPKADERVVSAKGGNDRNNVGSGQGFATALPPTGFSGTTNNGGAHARPMGVRTGGDRAGTNPANGLGHNMPGATMSVGAHRHEFTVTGGDEETRPRNVYVNWIIKIGSPQGGVAPSS